MKKLLCCLLTALMLLSLVACGEAKTTMTTADTTDSQTDAAAADPAQDTEQGTADPFYIAIAVPLTGDQAQYGEYICHGVMTKVNKINEAGGINGRQIVIETYDDKGDANEAATIAQKICDSNKYLCAFASFGSGTTLAGSPIYNKYKMVQIAPTASHTDISKAGGTTWAMNPSVMVEHKLVGMQAVQDLGGKRIALVHLNSDNGLQIEEAVTNGVTECGGEVVDVESYISGEVRDFSSIITRIKASEPDVVVLTMQYADTSAFLIQAKQFGFSEDVKWLLNTDSFMDSFLSAAGDAAEGVYVEASWSKLGTDEGIVSFRKAYNEMWDGEDPTSQGAQAYEAACIVVSALENGVTNTEELQSYLQKLGQWDGETFSGYFGEDQRFVREKVALSIVESGAFVPIY